MYVVYRKVGIVDTRSLGCWFSLYNSINITYNTYFTYFTINGKVSIVGTGMFTYEIKLLWLMCYTWATNSMLRTIVA